MGVFIYRVVSMHSFVTGMLSVSLFILISLLLRKLKFPMFSLAPLCLLLVLVIGRILVPIELPGSRIVLSQTVYPALIRVMRFELVPNRFVPITPFGIFVCVWVAGSVFFLWHVVKSYRRMYRIVARDIPTFRPDEQAEALLKEVVDIRHTNFVYRTACVFGPIALGIFRPYILLPPDMDYPPDELRGVLLHEWSHYRKRDNLTRLLANILWSLFWWNPFFYLFRINFMFAQEVECDRYVASRAGYGQHLKDALDRAWADYCESPVPELNALVSDEDELLERIELLRLRDEGKKVKWKIVNALISVLIVALFVASYRITILPIHWESSDVPVSAEAFRVDSGDWDIFRSEENLLVDNGDGTFSLYVDGQFMMYTSGMFETFDFIPQH